jgi:hypothetical protein
MGACGSCTKYLEPGKMLCRFCGSYTASETALITGVTLKNTTTLDKVEAAATTRLVTGGPWDEAWGGGIVPSSISMVGGPPGSGKALALDTPVPTATGWTTMGAIQIGERIFDDQGALCTVISTSDVMLGHECFELEFGDGERITADADHLWLTASKLERGTEHKNTPECRARRRARRGYVGPYRADLATAKRVNAKNSIKTTAQIAATIRKGAHANHMIERPGPLQTPTASLPIPPYLLGVWLGDGASAGGSYTSMDPEVAERIRASGFEVIQYQYKSTGRASTWRVVGLTSLLRKCGLLNNKRIPQEYLRASSTQRLELLRGLMDTDGTSDGKSNSCNFDTTSPQLRDDVQELLATLGLRAAPWEKDAKLHGRVISKVWRFIFTTPFRVFTIPRKSERQGMPTRQTARRQYIVGAKQVASVPVRCIAVDSPSKLFLVGRQMIPTHNTTMLLQMASQIAEQTGRRAYYLSAEQAPGEIKMTVERFGLPNLDRIRVMSEIGAGAEIDEAVFKEDPPSIMILDSISALVGKDAHAGIVIAKRYKKYAIKYGAPAFLICHMTKEFDFAGLLALQHEVDALVTIHPDEEDGSRTLKAWKCRYGPTHKEYRLIMTDRGLTAMPVKEKKGKAMRQEKLLGVDVENINEALKDFNRREREAASKAKTLDAPVVRKKAAKAPAPEVIEVRGQKLVNRKTAASKTTSKIAPKAVPTKTKKREVRA